MIIRYSHYQAEYLKKKVEWKEGEKWKGKLHIQMEFHSFIQKCITIKIHSVLFTSWIFCNGVNSEVSINHFYIDLSYTALNFLFFLLQLFNSFPQHSGLMKQSIMIFLCPYSSEDLINPINFYCRSYYVSNLRKYLCRDF